MLTLLLGLPIRTSLNSSQETLSRRVSQFNDQGHPAEKFEKRECLKLKIFSI